MSMSLVSAGFLRYKVSDFSFVINKELLEGYTLRLSIFGLLILRPLNCYCLQKVAFLPNVYYFFYIYTN